MILVVGDVKIAARIDGQAPDTTQACSQSYLGVTAGVLRGPEYLACPIVVGTLRGKVDITAAVDSNGSRIAKPAHNCRLGVAVGGGRLHENSAVVRIGDVDVAVRIHRNGTWPVETAADDSLAVAVSLCRLLVDSTGNGAAALIGNINVRAAVDRHRHWRSKTVGRGRNHAGCVASSGEGFLHDADIPG